LFVVAKTRLDLDQNCKIDLSYDGLQVYQFIEWFFPAKTGFYFFLSEMMSLPVQKEKF
jgi:hypothetical protein